MNSDQRPAPLSSEGRGCYFTSLFETELSSVVASLEEYKNPAETQITGLTTYASYLGKKYVCTGNKSVHLSCFLLEQTLGYQVWGNWGENGFTVK